MKVWNEMKILIWDCFPRPAHIPEWKELNHLFLFHSIIFQLFRLFSLKLIGSFVLCSNRPSCWIIYKFLLGSKFRATTELYTYTGHRNIWNTLNWIGNECFDAEGFDWQVNRWWNGNKGRDWKSMNNVHSFHDMTSWPSFRSESTFTNFTHAGFKGRNGLFIYPAFTNIGESSVPDSGKGETGSWISSMRNLHASKFDKIRSIFYPTSLCIFQGAMRLTISGSME